MSVIVHDISRRQSSYVGGLQLIGGGEGDAPEVTAAFGWLSKSQGEWRKKKKRKVSKGLRVAACYCLTLCSTEQKHKSVSFQSFTRGSVDHGSYGDASDKTLCCHSLEREWTNGHVAYASKQASLNPWLNDLKNRFVIPSLQLPILFIKRLFFFTVFLPYIYFLFFNKHEQINLDDNVR